MMVTESIPNPNYITFQTLVDRIRETGTTVDPDSLKVSTRLQAYLMSQQCSGHVSFRVDAEGEAYFTILPHGCNTIRGVQVDTDDYVSNDDQILTFNTNEGQICYYVIEHLLFPDDRCCPDA